MSMDSSCDILHLVYQKMLRNSNLAGSYKEADGHIVWQLFRGYTVDIASDYISINRIVSSKAAQSIHHWHPDDEVLYDEICRLGTRGNVTVIHLFGPGGMLGSSLVYSGPRRACPTKRKWFLGKYIYLLAEE